MNRTLHLICMLGLWVSVQAQNPCIHHLYTADPAPVIHEGNDSLYVYCDIDEGGRFFTMNEWRVFSTVDMVNWTDHGSALPLSAFAWAGKNSAWASQCVKRGDYYYWYVCAQKDKDWKHGIGVARSKKPSGPFTDALGRPLIWTDTGGDIDPTVFIDDDGQAYLYWGNNKVMYARLNPDMISYDTSVGDNGWVTVPMTAQSFGGVKDNDKEKKIIGRDAYEEGPWLSKRDGKYYLSYAAGGVPEHIAYSMSDSPEGPWLYQGQVMPLQDTGSFTNHSGVIDYKGKSYFVYHTGRLPGGGGFSRSFAIEEFRYNADGTIPELKATDAGVPAIATLSPYIRQQAETMNCGEHIKVVGNEATGVYVSDISENSSIRVKNVDFGIKKAKRLLLRYASDGGRVLLVIRLDGKDGVEIARMQLGDTNGKLTECSTRIQGKVTGIHDIVFTFEEASEAGTMKLDWWQFRR